MSKPPKTPPNSDIDGVAEDRKDNVDVAHAKGQGGKELKHAKDRSVGRPRYTENEPGGDDRTG